jgi:hypothetical protein
MRFITALAALALATVASAQGGNEPGLPPPIDQDWSCIKTQPEYTALLPKCGQYCHTLGLTTNGCDPDDFFCHCKSFYRTSAIIEPCSDDPALYPCTQNETLTFVGIARDFCTFWNTTAQAAQDLVKNSCSATGSCESVKKLTLETPNLNKKCGAACKRKLVKY